MKNFVQDGKTLPLTMTANVVSGQLVKIGDFVGVVACDAKIGERVEVAVEGVYAIAKAAPDAFTEGQAVKFDPATGIADAAGTAVAGVCTQAAGAGVSQVRVRLTPVVTVAVAAAEGTHAAPLHDAKPEHVHTKH